VTPEAQVLVLCGQSVYLMRQYFCEEGCRLIRTYEDKSADLTFTVGRTDERDYV